MATPDPAGRFADEAAASLADGSFVRLVLSPVSGTDDTPLKILGRCVSLKGSPHLSVTFRYATRDVTKNVPVGDSAVWLREQLGHGFRSALLGTTKADWQLIPRPSGPPRLISHKPARKQAPPRTHDRQRASLLDDSARDWLQGLGVLDRDGKLRTSMADKHRQINRYLEVLSHLVKECGWSEAPTGAVPASAPANGAADDTLALHSTSGMAQEARGRRPARQVVDMGCGKGYLTFGTWHLFRRVWKQTVRVLGVEVRPELVTASNKLARQIKADGLEFVSGTIESTRLPRVDALIALHACNTATDDAIRRGIEAGAKLLIVAPCCHKELRPQIGRPEPLAAVLRHGIMEERMAEWLTDGLRALFLEWAGYRTKVMEFVSSEHTPKNLMIAAVREADPFTDMAVRKRIEDVRTFFGIQHHALDKLLEDTKPG